MSSKPIRNNYTKSMLHNRAEDARAALGNFQNILRVTGDAPLADDAGELRDDLNRAEMLVQRLREYLNQKVRERK